MLASLGLITKAFVPAGVAMGPIYAVLQDPLVVQTYMEQQLVAKVKTLPRWLPTKCQVALRKYLCTKSFLGPERVYLSKALSSSLPPAQVAVIKARNFALYNDSLVLPSYPNITYCEGTSNSLPIVTMQ